MSNKETKETIVFTGKVIGYSVGGFFFLGMVTGFTWEGMQFVLALFGAAFIVLQMVKLVDKETRDKRQREEILSDPIMKKFIDEMNELIKKREAKTLQDAAQE